MPWLLGAGCVHHSLQIAVPCQDLGTALVTPLCTSGEHMDDKETESIAEPACLCHLLFVGRTKQLTERRSNRSDQLQSRSHTAVQGLLTHCRQHRGDGALLVVHDVAGWQPLGAAPSSFPACR